MADGDIKGSCVLPSEFFTVTTKFVPVFVTGSESGTPGRGDEPGRPTSGSAGTPTRGSAGTPTQGSSGRATRGSTGRVS